MYQLEGDLKYWEEHQTYDVLELSVRTHFKAVRIQPFLNGNGRWSGLLRQPLPQAKRSPSG